MPHKKNNPGCPCCCPTCLLASVPYQAGYWTRVQGDWSFSTNTAVTTDSNALLLVTTPPAETTDHSVEFSVGALGSVGAVAYHYAFYANASNHVYVKWTTTGSFSVDWEVHEVIGGVDSTLQTGSAVMGAANFFTPVTQEPYAVILSLYGDELLVYIPDDYTFRWYTLTVSNPSALGLYFGLGTGAADRWYSTDGVVVRKEHTYCWTKWPGVIRDTLPSQVQIVVTGAQNYPAGNQCNHCQDELNQTFLLDPLTKANFAGTLNPNQLPGNLDPYYELPGYYRYLFDEQHCYTYPLPGNPTYGANQGSYYWQWEYPQTVAERLTPGYIGRLRLYSDEQTDLAGPIRGQWELNVLGVDTCDIFDATNVLATPRSLIYQTAAGTGSLYTDTLCDISNLAITAQSVA